jgi:hypothetical protein
VAVVAQIPAREPAIRLVDVEGKVFWPDSAVLIMWFEVNATALYAPTINIAVRLPFQKARMPSSL